MKIPFFYTSLLLGIWSCETEQLPPISNEKMIEILADVHFAESVAQALPLKQKDTMMVKYYDQIMEIHQVSRIDFDSSVVLLKQKPEELLKIYEKVMEKMDKDKSMLTK